MRNEDRTDEFRRNAQLETVLAAMNGELARLGGSCEGPPQTAQPPVLVVGCARCGTTLMMQWLAASGRFTYASNLVSRFYAAPWIGARVQQILTDPACAFGDELAGVDEAAPDWYRSRLGKTRGLLAPNEFWYYWRRFFPEGETHHVDEATWPEGNGRRFARELARWEAVTGRPLVLKAAILAWNLPLLARLLPRAVFLHVRREPVANLQSLLLARRRYFDRDDRWYSFRPPEYPDLVHLPVPEQLAAQLHHTDRAIVDGLSGLSPDRVLVVTYEDFCADPAAVHAALRDKLRTVEGPDLGAYAGPPRFEASRARRITTEEQDALAAAWAKVTRERACPVSGTRS